MYFFKRGIGYLAGILGIALVIVGCSMKGQQSTQQYTIEEFLGTTNYAGASFSPDNSKILVSSNETGIFNAYAIPVEGGEPTQLTDSKENSIFAIGYFPEDERFLYTQDEGGNELNHIYVQNTDGSTTDLTPGDSLKASFNGWSGDKDAVYIETNERDKRFFDLYKLSLDDYSRTMLYRNEEGFSVSDVSSDERYIALHKTITNADSDIYLYDLKTKEQQLLTEHEGDVNFNPQFFSKDGKYLYYTTNEGYEFQYLVKHNLETDEVETVKKYDWNIMYAGLSDNGNYLTIGINEDARTKVEMFNTETMEPVAIPELPNASISSVYMSDDEQAVAFYASNSKMPGDLFTYSLDADAESQKLTQSLNEKINPDDLVAGENLRFNSYDGVEIPGIMYKPHQASEENKVPALVWVHGGPGGQSRIGYSGLIQYLVNHGYAIYAINNRGSSGYGKTFYHMDDKKHGDADLDDCVASKQMLIDTGYVNPEKIGILGGSYGGYMTLAALTFRPEEFDVGVDLFGISNWYRTVQNIPPWWGAMKVALEKELGDFDDEQFFKEKSPLFHADQITKPLMVLQGANDPRVIKAESDDIVKAVRENDVPVEYIVFEDEGHGFLKKENRIEGYKAILQFLDTHLKNATEVASI